MKNKLIFLLLITGLLASCTSLQTPTPAPTSIHATPTGTATSLPTETPTNTPAPTGGSGQLWIVLSNALKAINADGSGSQTVISKQQFEKEFTPVQAKDVTPNWHSTLSPDGKKILVLTCNLIMNKSCSNYKLYLSDVDFKRVKTFQSYRGEITKWSPDSKNIIVLSTGKVMDVISAGDDFGKVTHLPIASSAFWSADGKSIYYYHDGWFVIKSDGTGVSPLKCDLCALASNPANFAVAESPNGQLIAIGTTDGMIAIANSSDFSQFKLASVGSYVSQLYWSPDSQKLAADLNPSTSQSDVVILGADATVIEKLPRPDGVNYFYTCGWSPDSTQITVLTLLSSSFDIYIHTVGQPQFFHLFNVKDNLPTCPVWLPGGAK